MQQKWIESKYGLSIYVVLLLLQTFIKMYCISRHTLRYIHIQIQILFLCQNKYYVIS